MALDWTEAQKNLVELAAPEQIEMVWDGEGLTMTWHDGPESGHVTVSTLESLILWLSGDIII
jgi:hypothetical protein